MTTIYENTNIKFLYVCVSNEKDLYYEQMLVSMLSLKHHNPDAYIVLLTDNITAETLTEFRGGVKLIAKDLKVVDLNKSWSAKVRSRYLKTNMRNLIDGDFLFIDCDTAITDTLDIQNFDFEIGAVLENHSKINEFCSNFWQKYLLDISKKLEFSPYLDFKHFSSGVLFVKDSAKTRDFFKLWNELYNFSSSKGFEMDQMAFNEANFRFGNIIHELPGEWNCQVTTSCINHLTHVKILHFWAGGNKGQGMLFHPLMTKEFFKNIKNKQGIDEKSMQVICNANKAFFEHCSLVGPKVSKWTWSRVLYLPIAFPRFFGFLDKILFKFKFSKKENEKWT